MFTASALVVCEHGLGFLDQRGELHKVFGTHVSPAPREVRPATSAEAREFFEHRLATRHDLCAFYRAPGFRGD